MNLKKSIKKIKAILVYPNFLTKSYSKELVDYKYEEAQELVKAINIEIYKKKLLNIKKINPKTLLNSGHIDSLNILLKEEKIDLLIFNSDLSPIQQRNLEKELSIKILDRTGLILEIFAKRARTHEGMLQVKLASLNYEKSRLVRTWTHLERQRGGLGATGGPGEKQLEIDRRLIDKKIVSLKKKLENVKKTRAMQRGSRKKIPYPIVSIVGYTNTGKSTLFNCLTGENIFAKNLLFATLDPTMRKINLGNNSNLSKEIILSDTVGFISDLPHHLIASFRATLEEVIESDIIIHLKDISSHFHEQQTKDVLKVLEDIGINDNNSKIIEVWNKIDLSNNAMLSPKIEKAKINGIEPVLISAIKKSGINNLKQQILKKLYNNSKDFKIIVNISDSKLTSYILNNINIMKKTYSEKETIFKVKLNEIQVGKILKNYPKYHLEKSIIKQI